MRPEIARIGKDVLSSTIGYSIGLFRPPPTKFIIFTNGRTGSNWLVSLLRSHSKIRIHSEIFGEHQLDNPVVKQIISRRGPIKHFEICFRRVLNEDYVGLKMLYYNIDEQYGADRKVGGLSKLGKHLLKDPDVKFIHLKRLNHIDRLLSNAQAVASGAFLNGKYLEEKINIDLVWAHEELERMVAWENKFDRYLPKDRTFTTTYEEMVDQPNLVLKRIFQFLGCTEIAATSSVKKQNKKGHQDIIKNYIEFKDSLEGTMFETMLE